MVSIVGATTDNLPPGVLYRVKATYKYTREDVDELSFEVGEIIRVVEYDDPEEQVGEILKQREERRAFAVHGGKLVWSIVVSPPSRSPLKSHASPVKLCFLEKDLESRSVENHNLRVTHNLRGSFSDWNSSQPSLNLK